jgi:hypothetical protein
MPNRLIMKKGCHVLNSTHSDVHVQSCAHVYQQTGLVCEPYPNYAFNFTKRTFQEQSIENISATSCCPAPIARFVKQRGLLFWLAISLGRLRYVKMSKASSIWETTSIVFQGFGVGDGISSTEKTTRISTRHSCVIPRLHKIINSSDVFRRSKWSCPPLNTTNTVFLFRFLIGFDAGQRGDQSRISHICFSGIPVISYHCPCEIHTSRIIYTMYFH